MKRIINIFLLILFFSIQAQAQIVDEFFDPTNYENERRLLLLENSMFTVTGTSGGSGTVGTGVGGTGQDFSSVSQYSVIYFDPVGTMTTLGPGIDGQVLTTNGTSAPPAWEMAGSSQTFTSDGTFTAPNVRMVYLTLIGGGGGSGGGISAANESGGGGGSGILVLSHPFVVTPGATYSVQVGAGGTAGDNINDGGDGGSTIFDSGGAAITAQGGSGGHSGTNGSVGGDTPTAPVTSPDYDANATLGGDGGNMTLPSYYVVQGTGSTGLFSGSGVGGGGGGNIFGEGPDGSARGFDGTSPTSTFYGVGAGGGGDSNPSGSTLGAAGADGVCIVSY